MGSGRFGGLKPRERFVHKRTRFGRSAQTAPNRGNTTFEANPSRRRDTIRYGNRTGVAIHRDKRTRAIANIALLFSNGLSRQASFLWDVRLRLLLILLRAHVDWARNVWGPACRCRRASCHSSMDGSRSRNIKAILKNESLHFPFICLLFDTIYCEIIMNTADTPSTEKKKFYMVVWPDPRTQNWDDANKSEDEVRFVWKFGDGRDNVSNPYKNANMKKFLAKDEWSSWAEGIKGDAAWCMSHGAFEKQGYYRVTGAMKPMKYGAGYPGKVAEIQVLEGTEQTDHQGELRLVKNERVGINEFAKDNLMVLLGDIAKVETELEAAAFYDKALDIFLEIDPPEGEQLDKDK